MKEYRLAEGEAKFADLIWDNEPIGSMQLVKLSETQLGWKKSTTYTVLKKLCGRGLFQNEDAVVTSLVTREEFVSGKSRQFVEESFGGSLPKFLTAFIGKQKLSNSEVEELKILIENYKEEA
ncbi:MAG: BlaI/MecI/CopY family transcriptional regulator [Lachnospiraceae bacterium]|nr:BlaI/MecI/CopY family transcriptional regulator [Lachnospiraceae bacterium]